MKKVIYIIIAVLAIGAVKAQEVEFSLGADVVSSYVWRGAYQTGAAIQPAAGVSVAGFSLSAWGSVPVFGVAEEVDFTAAYEIAGLSLAITDYWCVGEGDFGYFSYRKDETAHAFEATIGYELPIEKFPLSLSWNTFFGGADHKLNGDRAYSTYISAAYPFSVKNTDLEASVGITPWEGAFADDFAVVNIGLKATRELKITNSISLPVFGEIIINPKSEDVFFVFGISL